MASPKIVTNKARYKISLKNLEILNKKLIDLTKLNTELFLKLDNRNLLLYTYDNINGKSDSKNLHSFKSHHQKIDDTFDVVKDQLDDEILYKIANGKRFTSSITMFIKYMSSQDIKESVDFILTYYPDSYAVEKLTLKNKKSKEITPGVKPTDAEDIDLSDIDDFMDLSRTYTSFQLKEDDYRYIKNKNGIEKDNEVLYLTVKDKKLTIGETTWELNISDIEDDIEDEIKAFPKKFWKCINYDNDDIMTVYIAETYLLIIGETSNLLLSVETDY